MMKINKTPGDRTANFCRIHSKKQWLYWYDNMAGIGSPYGLPESGSGGPDAWSVVRGRDDP